MILSRVSVRGELCIA